MSQTVSGAASVPLHGSEMVFKVNYFEKVLCSHRCSQFSHESHEV